jgi:hypothetical protein
MIYGNINYLNYLKSYIYITIHGSVPDHGPHTQNILAAQHVRQLVFTHRLGKRQASVVLAARVVEVRMVKRTRSRCHRLPPPHSTLTK